MMSKTINVVGSGLAGSLVTHVLREAHYNVRVIDDNDAFSASRASSNLYINHWLKKFASHEATRGVKTLERLFGNKITEPFNSGLGYAAKVRHIAQRDILVEADIPAKVEHASPDGSLCMVGNLNREMNYKGPTVLCLGYRAASLVRGYVVEPKVGHCALFHGQLPEGKGHISMIAPYRHEKLYNLDAETIYYSDSLAVSLETYRKRAGEYSAKLLHRAMGHFDSLQMEPRLKCIRVGYRPITPKDDFGRIDRFGPGLWSINGGGKNGMVAYANLACELLEQLET